MLTSGGELSRDHRSWVHRDLIWYVLIFLGHACYHIFFRFCISMFYLQVEQVGPFVYRFGSMKKNIAFDSKKSTVKYKSQVQSVYDDQLTKDMCANCSNGKV